MNSWHPTAHPEHVFADPDFEQWAALELAVHELGHTTQTFQGLRAWLLSVRDGETNHTASATRDRYRRILDAATRLCGPPCLERTRTPAEVDQEVAHVRDALAASGEDEAIVADGTHWWRCKIEGVPARLGNGRTNTVTARLRKHGFERPTYEIRVFPQWGPGQLGPPPHQEPVCGAWHHHLYTDTVRRR